MSESRFSTDRVSGEILTLTLMGLAATAWWLTAMLFAGMGSDSTMAPMSLGPFLLAWMLMMAAMMLPAVAPVVRLYHRAAAAHRVAPSGYFVLAYLAAWTVSGLPAYLLWRVLAMPLSQGVRVGRCAWPVPLCCSRAPTN